MATHDYAWQEVRTTNDVDGNARSMVLVYSLKDDPNGAWAYSHAFTANGQDAWYILETEAGIKRAEAYELPMMRLSPAEYRAKVAWYRGRDGSKVR